MTLRNVLLAIHIAAGSIGLFAAPVAMLTAKGGKVHRFAGKVFYRCMAVVSVTAAVLVIAFGASAFLLLVAVLSFYSAFRGVRALRRKRPERDKATTVDWIGAGAALAAGLGFLSVPWLPGNVFGIGANADAQVRVAAGSGSGFTPVAYVFGGLLIFGALRQMWDFVRPSTERNAWWFAHMAGMLAAYIAFITAFSVLNFTFLPRTVRWLWPTVLGTPGIVVWVRYYRAKFARAPAARATTSAVVDERLDDLAAAADEDLRHPQRL